jgi:RHS repeat-associated protein
MGFAKEITSTDEKNMKSTSYFDLYGRLRLSILDSVNTFITTKYNYDDLGRLKNVIHENNDTTMYWYDDWGRIKYKYKTEIGYVSYSYDDMGRLRFTQNSMQSMDHKLNYYQYDDLGRITVQGEASIDIESIDSTIAEPVYLAYDNVVFERLTDNLDPNRLYYQDFGVTDAGILTLNSTLFDGTLSFSPVILDTTTSFYGSNIFDSHSTYPTPYMRHDYTLGTHTPAFADYLDFEDVGLYPEFIRKAVYYDEYPVNEGNIWGELPSKVKVDSIAGNIASNSKGRPTAIAYRDEDGEKLHYSTFGYDARGRITKIIRYNEYLGFDGVFYEYNSANQIIKEVSADPMKQMVTWYSYDQSGRMDSIWVSLDTTGSGFGIETLKMVSQLNKEIDADIAFKYDRNGRTDSIIYNKVDVIQSINYSNRGWVDSLVVNRNSDEILKIAFDRDINGMIDTQRVSYWTKDPLKVKYTYDDYYRLESFESLINGTTNKTESYEYDKMGNRTKKTNSAVTNYAYGSGLNSNKLMSFAEFGSNDVTQYEYNEIGGVDKVKSFNPMTMVTNTKEEFDYLSNGLVKRYVEHVEAATYPPLSPCVTSETYTSGSNTWIYRYNESNQLESKRLLQSDSGDVCSTHSWVYNKIGAYGDVKTVYHGRQYKISSRKVIFYPDKYLSANGLVEIFPDGTKEYNILDNMNSTRMKIKDNDTTVTFADYEPYGENQLHSIDDIPKRGYMGSHKSKEHRYMQMGARLYNAETGRFMSVDPLMEIFTGHSPYHYSYNNPVMYRDPSGLAPEGEKNNTVQAEGADNISSGYTGGYWTTKVTFSYKNYFTKNLDDPLAPRGRTFHSDETITIENTFIPSSGAGGGGGVSISMPESNGGFNGNRNSSRITYNNTTNKSMRDQNAVSDNTRVQKEPQLQNFDNLLDKLQIAQANDRIDKLNEQFVDDYIKNPLTVSGVYLGIREYGLERNGQWRGKNGQWVSVERVTGNQYLGSRTQVTNLASKFRLAGKVIGGLSMFISFYEGIGYISSGDYMSAGKSSADIFFTYLSFTGPVGFTVSGIYFIIDMSGGFDESVYHSYNPNRNSFIQDNTQIIRSVW